MCLSPKYIKGLTVPCRKCIECLIQYSDEWSYRILLEAQKHTDNCFLTLTYNEDNLPQGASLRKRDFQLFIKRLRKYLSGFAIKIRYFGCGEYGSKRFSHRPHYHIIIFGWKPADMYYFFTDKKGVDMYRSNIIEKLWKFGFSTVSFVSNKTAKYCAKYLTVGQMVDTDKEKPFLLMSRRPGIALDVFPESVFTELSVYLYGKRYLAPRSFMKKVKEFDEELFVRLKEKRLQDTYGIKAFENLIDSIDYSYDKSRGEYIPFLDDPFNDNKKLYKALSHMIGDLVQDKENQRKIDIENRKKKYLKIFENCLDKDFKLLYSYKEIRETMRKST